MKRKPIKIDWDELEEAFSNPQEAAEAYLDSVTGRIVLGGEGGDASEDDEDAFERAGAAPVPVRENPTHLAIQPPDTEVKVGWMTVFLEEQKDDHDPAALEALSDAMDAEEPAEAIGDILKGNPALRDAWYVFRSERIQEMIDEWLEAHDVTVVDPPPWR